MKTKSLLVAVLAAVLPTVGIAQTPGPNPQAPRNAECNTGLVPGKTSVLWDLTEETPIFTIGAYPDSPGSLKSTQSIYAIAVKDRSDYCLAGAFVSLTQIGPNSAPNRVHNNAIYVDRYFAAYFPDIGNCTKSFVSLDPNGIELKFHAEGPTCKSTEIKITIKPITYRVK